MAVMMPSRAEDDSTIVVQPDYRATVDRYANLEITRGEGR